ncbi:MAG TPA: response regulator transcription factor [Candidatus Faecenecus gallistercoris]|uniref:Response regulator transcription factor n=1 Tax=Candidatus Faecenecus gallistercoris TaxID=2840793 RepID=A0A9D0YZ04_9FIRM|nr:response regulator transcription factor [Candidatus Faecenecus gallistercoris]
MNIAIIEDDLVIREKLSLLLQDAGYQTTLIEDFEHVVDTLLEEDANLILLDINLPFMDGYDICKKIKEKSNIPIIFVTSRDTTEDEIKSIQVGGVDFITKPYNKIVLLEKIKRALKLNDPIHFRELTKNGYTLDLHLSILKYQDQEIELTRNEFRILYYFFTNPGRIITKDELLEKLWNDKYYLDDNILAVNMNRLRNKAKEIGITEFLTNIRGKGYKL